ncbi:hypothetical protein GH714_016400 [Hevea brasiliensis]|uniref:Ammonium transporter AmtB-like domain-containing protein n=1 Tax=Hevea brasiliensis TaxID=3981 RepID=A0A6A6M1S5_HEVBR|nr:hypothetical protein GH714_016400 [Hevea brasiliensis]
MSFSYQDRIYIPLPIGQHQTRHLQSGTVKETMHGNSEQSPWFLAMDSVWKHGDGEEEMGCQLCFYGPAWPASAKPIAALSQDFLLEKSRVGQVSMADYVFSQFAFAAITVILLAGIWGGGFLDQYIIDYAGGSVIHLSSGMAGFTASYWGPTLPHDSQHFPPNNIIHILGGAGFLWLELTGFNGGSPFTAGGAMGSNVMGAMSGSVTWYTMMILYGTSAFFHSVDDTLAVSNARSGWPSRRNSVRPPW